MQTAGKATMNSSLSKIVSILTLAACLAGGERARAAAAAVTEADARSIALDAYLYFYPLVTMDLTRRQLINVARPDGPRAPMNLFANMPAYPTADMKDVVRPNFDTLYSSAWLDLTKDPVVVSVPNTHGRYYLLPMLDMWSDVFASPGWRTTGTGEDNFLITPPGWNGAAPSGMTRISAPTLYVWIIGRIKTDGPPDYDAVHKIQAGFRIKPLAEWGKDPEPIVGSYDLTLDMKTPPKVQVDGMPAEKFFNTAMQLMMVHPPHVTDEPILARMKRIGIEAGHSFSLEKLDPVVGKAIEGAPAAAQALMKWKLPTLARVANNWSMNTDTMGVYGNYYLKRALIAQEGLGANLPEDAIYPFNLGDEAGKPLDGASKYTLHFDKANLPPVDAFWSITLYDPQGYQVANPLNRFAISSWMPFHYNGDGSLDLYFQNQDPGGDKSPNWLPAPKGPFNLTMRLYAPKSDALTGKWNPPPVKKAAAN